MIVVRLIGGLGNQMFQYAAGRALSLKHGVPLLLDVSEFSGYKLHQGFELERLFNCKTEIAQEKDMRQILGWQSNALIRRILTNPKMAFFRQKSLVIEPQFHYWSEVNNISTDCYLAGYWQSDKYFSDFSEEVRSAFTFKLPLNDENALLASRIKSSNAVSLHVRRGDYVANSKNIATYAVCSLEYYELAIKYISDKVDSPYFYIFSDDVSWTRDNLKIDFPHCFVDCNKSRESYNDMRLMSVCSHHIIANSSFSWWGAWLNPCDEKIVIAPKKWFLDEKNTNDLIPDDWIVL